MTHNSEAQEQQDVTGFVFLPPVWDEERLRHGEDAAAITKIAMDTYTDIAYIKEKNAIQIIGETHDDVYKAQTSLNTLFFPVIVKSKRQWARPDRPGIIARSVNFSGSWGQRRDGTGSGMRRMKSESALKSAGGAVGGAHNYTGWGHQHQRQGDWRKSYQQVSTSGSYSTWQ